MFFAAKFRSDFRMGLAATLVLLFLTGCGSGGPRRYVVSGTVTYDGKPVPIGTISLEPRLEAGKLALTGFAIIQDGKFRTERDQGAGAGPYLVRIRAGDGSGSVIPSGSSLDPEAPPPVGRILFGNRLFEEYTLNVELPEKDSTIAIDIPAM